jgi:Protein of unknown function (DUF664)
VDPVIRLWEGSAMDAEAEQLEWFLDAQRDSALAIIEGLSLEHLNTVVFPSGWSPLGLIEHLGWAERNWFQMVMLGSAPPVLWAKDVSEDEDDEFRAYTTDRPPSDVIAWYREQISIGQAVVASTPLAAPPVGRHNWGEMPEITDLRSVMLHMIEETARHCGHLDVARELLDGRTGLGPR